MTTEVERATALLFGSDGLGVTNVGLTRGFATGLTADDVARELAGSLERLARGDTEVAHVPQD